MLSISLGLDPSGLLFEPARPGHCISAGDAQFVEIIHTAISGGISMSHATGDTDYYPNGGSIHPGCPNDESLTCYHNRAFEFYAEAINSANSFISRKCYNYENFTKGFCDDNETVSFPGAQKIIKPRGTYYLQTDSKRPFGLGEKGSKSSNY